MKLYGGSIYFETILSQFQDEEKERELRSKWIYVEYPEISALYEEEKIKRHEEMKAKRKLKRGLYIEFDDE